MKRPVSDQHDPQRIADVPCRQTRDRFGELFPVGRSRVVLRLRIRFADTKVGGTRLFGDRPPSLGPLFERRTILVCPRGTDDDDHVGLTADVSRVASFSFLDHDRHRQSEQDDARKSGGSAGTAHGKPFQRRSPHSPPRQSIAASMTQV